MFLLHFFAGFPEFGHNVIQVGFADRLTYIPTFVNMDY